MMNEYDITPDAPEDETAPHPDETPLTQTEAAGPAAETPLPEATPAAEPAPEPDSPAAPTYRQVYTPGTDGYTRQSTPEPGIYTPPVANGHLYTAYTPSPSYASAPASPKKPRTRKGWRVLGIAAGILALALVCTGLGYAVAKDHFAPETDKQVLADDTLPADTQTDLSLSSDTGSDAETPNSEAIQLEKHNSVSEDASGGEIGTLMTKAQVVSLVKDAVVEITTEKVVTGSIFSQYVASGAGSGVIISDSGYVITNHHVIEDASSITVRLTNGSEYPARIIGSDASADIAVIRFEPTDPLTVATLGTSANLLVGEEIVVIGNPLGLLGGTVTNGIISALDRDITIAGESMKLMQTNAAVNPGNSGGGMFNLRGELVGIVNAKASESGIEGLGFAIPIDSAYEVVLQLMEYGYVRGRIDHGLSLIDITDIYTAVSYHVSSLGVYVYESKYTDEIKNGDRIASVNGIEVATSSDVKAALKNASVGDTATFTVVRGGKLVTVELVLHEYNPSSDSDVEFGQ